VSRLALFFADAVKTDAMRATAVAFSILLLVAISAIFVFVSVFDLSAIPQPGKLETYLADRVRHYFVRRAATRATIPPAPPDRQASIAEGDTLYGVECGACHGLDGRTPTDAGRWMYPRAADLTARSLQDYSDRELFWIVKNGIRFTGMPAFDKVEPEEHIWNLTQYVRTLQSQHP
jgi:mono/diheme cytochrome c family protein